MPLRVKPIVFALAGLGLTLGLFAVPASAAPAKPKKGKVEKAAETPEPEPVPVAPEPVVVAAPPPPPPETPVFLRRHALNLNPEGAVAGDYALIYHWMFAAGHGLIAELTGTYAKSADGLTKGLGGQVGYRYFTNGTHNSWFFGAMAGYDAGNSLVVITTGGTDQPKVVRTYNLPYRRIRATATVGRRWVFGPGLNVTARLGIGPGQRTYTRGGNAEAEHEAASIETLANFLPVSLDSELSIGWVF